MTQLIIDIKELKGSTTEGKHEIRALEMMFSSAGKIS